MIITKAQQIIIEYITIQNQGVFTPQIIEEDTIETQHGWIFFYDSKEFLETDDFSYAIAGNGPIAVNKHDGTIHNLTPSISTEAILSEFERSIEKSEASK